MIPTVAASALEAIEIVLLVDAGQPFDLIITDVYMPEMDGFAFVEKLKADRMAQSSMMMMITSVDIAESAERCRALGVAQYIVKPVSKRSLLRAIMGAIDMGANRLPAPPRQLRCSMKPVSDVTYRMLAADASVKWHGLSVNGQYFFRWLNNFRADGPIPVASTFDHGFETTVGAFIAPKKWELYGRTSFVFGQFRNSYEYAPGVKWYPLGNHRVYVVAEGLRIFNSPVASIITPYNSGFKGWSPMLQWMFNF